MSSVSRHPSLLISDDALLLVVDMQEPFLRNIHLREKIVSNIKTLILGSKILRLPIVPTLQYQERMGDIIPEIKGLLPHGCVPFDKLTFSVLGDSACRSEISRSGRRQIIVCGVESHICVLQSSLELMAAGYQVHIVSDAVSSRTAQNYEIGLQKAKSAGAVLTSVETALYEMLVEAGTPEFREILALIK